MNTQNCIYPGAEATAFIADWAKTNYGVDIDPELGVPRWAAKGWREDDVEGASYVMSSKVNAAEGTRVGNVICGQCAHSHSYYLPMLKRAGLGVFVAACSIESDCEVNIIDLTEISDEEKLVYSVASFRNALRNTGKLDNEQVNALADHYYVSESPDLVSLLPKSFSVNDIKAFVVFAEKTCTTIRRSVTDMSIRIKAINEQRAKQALAA